MYGHARAEGGTGTPGITGGCRCPRFGTPRAKMPDGPMDEAEIEIDRARLEVQRALDAFCDIVKMRLRERRGDTTTIDARVVLGRRPMPEILREPPPTVAKPTRQAPPPTAHALQSNGALHLSPCHRKILAALISYGRRTAHQVSILTGYRPSGGFNGALADLRAEGYVERGSPIAITEAGRQAIGYVAPLPTGRALFDYWLHKLDPCAGAILETLATNGPMTARDVAEVTEYTQSGGFNGALAKLRAIGLVKKGQPIEIAEELRR